MSLAQGSAQRRTLPRVDLFGCGLMSVALGLVFASRGVGWLLDGSLNEFHRSALAFEFVLTLASFVVWRRTRC